MECKYKSVNKCASCGYIVWQECRDFVRARTFDLTRKIRPYHHVSVNVPERTVYSCNEDHAKSAATLLAIKFGLRVIPVTPIWCQHHVFDSSDSAEHAVYYVAVKEKCTWESGLAKYVDMLRQFAFEVLERGGCVVFHCTPLSGVKFPELPLV